MSVDSYRVQRTGQQTVVTLPADIDVTNSGRIHTVLLQAVDDGAAVLIADLSATEFCASAGVQVLTHVHHAALAAGARLRVAAPSSMVQRVLELTGASHLIDTYPSLAAALAGPPVPAGGSGPAAGSLSTEGPGGGWLATHTGDDPGSYVAELAVAVL